MRSIFLLSRVCPVVSGPSVTISFIAKRIAVMLTPYGDSRTAGSKSFTECGWIEPHMTPSSIIAIRSGTAPGSFNLKHVNNPSLFPLKTDRKSKLAASYGVKQEIVLSGLVADSVIHYPDKPPKIQGTLRIEPEKALPYTRVEIRGAQGELIFKTPLPLSPHPYSFSLPAETYSFQAQIEPMQTEYSEQFGIRVVHPPEFTWTVNVSRRNVIRR